MQPDIHNLSARLWHALLQADKAAATPLIDDAAVNDDCAFMFTKRRNSTPLAA